jgi:hypothetical protein
MQLTHPVRWACDSERVVGRTEIGFRSHPAGRGSVMSEYRKPFAGSQAAEAFPSTH